MFDSSLSPVYLSHAQRLWDYLGGQTPAPYSHGGGFIEENEVSTWTNADGLLLLGSHDMTVPALAADLWHQGLASWVMVSGAQGKITRESWQNSEAQMYAQALLASGIPESALHLEDQSTHTGDNLAFSLALMIQQKLAHGRLIIVSKPYMTRRVMAVMQLHYPQVEYRCASAAFSYQAYIAQSPLAEEKTLAMMLGNVERMERYAVLGYHAAQPLPEQILASYKSLLAAGIQPL